MVRHEELVVARLTADVEGVIDVQFEKVAVARVHYQLTRARSAVLRRIRACKGEQSRCGVGVRAEFIATLALRVNANLFFKAAVGGGCQRIEATADEATIGEALRTLTVSCQL